MYSRIHLQEVVDGLVLALAADRRRQHRGGDVAKHEDLIGRELAGPRSGTRSSGNDAALEISTLQQGATLHRRILHRFSGRNILAVEAGMIRAAFVVVDVVLVTARS